MSPSRLPSSIGLLGSRWKAWSYKHWTTSHAKHVPLSSGHPMLALGKGRSWVCLLTFSQVVCKLCNVRDSFFT